MTAWNDRPGPDENRQQWHTGARERDEERLAHGPDDDTETNDGPWSGGATDEQDRARPTAHPKEASR